MNHHIAQQQNIDLPIISVRRSALLQRKCACGQHTVAGGECAECHKKRLQRKAAGHTGPKTVPPIVHEVLRSPGQSLDAGTRAYMEPRFGHDFSRVRVHTDARAAESARAVNALAYTVGWDVVFGDGQYAPGSSQGMHLIAHELTHTIQQQVGATALQTNLSIGPTNDHYEREVDKVAESIVAGNLVGQIHVAPVSQQLQRACDAATIGSVGGCIGVGGQDITDISFSRDQLYLFQVSCDHFLPGEEARLRSYAATISPDEIVEIHGFASEEGDPVFNNNLSCARAYTAADILAEEGVLATTTLFQHGATQGLREDRRSVVITFGFVPPSSESEESESPPKFICGPDVTEEIISAMSEAGAAFDKLSDGDQADSCSALVFTLEGALGSWDIIQLYRENNGWIHKNYRPSCASKGAKPVCGITVQVGDQCYDSGAANYVLFGFYMKKCYDVYGGKYPAVRHLYTKSSMLDLIDEYKGPGSILGEAKNWRTARQWAEAGYAGWPTGGTPPPGNFSHCKPVCPIKFSGPDFKARWCPHIDPSDQCPIVRVQPPS